MNKFRVLILGTIVLILGTVASAQRSGLFSETLSASGVGSQTVSTLGATSYGLGYTTTGTPGAISIQIEGTTDGTTFNICGSAVTNTTSGSSSCTGTFLKVRANVTSLTGGTAPTVTYALTAGYGIALNGTGAVPIITAGADADALANNPMGFPATSSGQANGLSVAPLVFNGTTWDRLRGTTTGISISSTTQSLADALTNGPTLPNSVGNGVVYQGVLNYGFNNTTWDRLRTASLSNFPTTQTLTARNTIGVQLSEKGSRWSVSSAPASGTIGSASIAAEASVRHVIDCISFSAAASGAVTAADTNVTIRDGATGAGTVIWNIALGIPTAAGIGLQEIGPHSFCGLNLVGTTNTAMTAEYTAGVTGLLESVSISGYNVN